MQVTYELSQRDFQQCFIAHRNRTFWSRWSYRLMALLIIMLVGLALLLLVARRDSEVISTALPLLGLAAFWSLLVWGSPWLMARSQYSKQPSAQGPRTVRFDEFGAHWKWDGGTSDVAWKNIIRYLEGKDQILLYTSPACFNILPKRALTSDQLATIRSLLEQNIR